MNGVGIQVVHALEVLSGTQRPVDRCRLDIQHFLNLVHHLDRIANIPVQLVDKRQNRRGAQTAHIHQLDGAILDTLGTVDHHQRRIHGGQYPVGIFGEVLVPRRIQQVHYPLLVRKLHHGRGHGDAPLLLHGHPVRTRMRPFLALYRARELNRISEQQQLFGHRGFTGVRVRNDGKGTAAIDARQVRRLTHNAT